VHNTTACIAAAAEQSNGVLDTVNFYNNLCYDNYWPMFIGSDNGVVKNIKVIGNTFVDNDPSTMSLGVEIGSFEGTSETGLVDNVVVRNNIISQNNRFQLVVDQRPGVTNIFVDNNLIDGFRGYKNEIYGSSYITGNPQFVNPSGADFHLQSTSPAIDRGYAAGAPFNTDFDDNARPQGAGYDIGAYEYGSSPCIPNWQCEQPLNGYEADGCGNRRLNTTCNPQPIPPSDERIITIIGKGGGLTRNTTYRLKIVSPSPTPPPPPPQPTKVYIVALVPSFYSDLNAFKTRADHIKTFTENTLPFREVPGTLVILIGDANCQMSSEQDSSSLRTCGRNLAISKGYPGADISGGILGRCVGGDGCGGVVGFTSPGSGWFIAGYDTCDKY